MVLQKGHAFRFLIPVSFAAFFLSASIRASAGFWPEELPTDRFLYDKSYDYNGTIPSGFSGTVDLGRYDFAYDGFREYYSLNGSTDKVDLTYNPSSNKVTGTITDNAPRYTASQGFAYGSKHFCLRSTPLGSWRLPNSNYWYIEVDTLFTYFEHALTPSIRTSGNVSARNPNTYLVVNIDGVDYRYGSASTEFITLDANLSHVLIFYVEVEFDAAWSVVTGGGGSAGSVDVSCSYSVSTPGVKLRAAYTTFQSYLFQTLRILGHGLHSDLMELKQTGSLGQTNQLIQQGNDLQKEANDLQQEANDLQKEQNETSRGIFGAIKDFFGGFFANLGNTVMGWIVPTSDQLTEFLQEINDWFSARLGFIWYPFSLAIDMVSALAGGSADQVFHVPALRLSILGQEHAIWGDIDVDLDAFGIFVYVRFFTSALLVAGVVHMAIDKWDEWIGGHNT